MKLKLAVPTDVLTKYQIGLIETVLAQKLLSVVAENFPNWRKRAQDGDITGGEIIIQESDMVRPIAGLKPGIHVTISLVSFAADRNFDGLALNVIDLIKCTEDDSGHKFMKKVGIFVQMTLDRPVTKFMEGDQTYIASANGLSLLEYSG